MKKDVSKKQKRISFIKWHLFSMAVFVTVLIVGLCSEMSVLSSIGTGLLCVVFIFPQEAFWRWYVNIKPDYKPSHLRGWTAMELEYGHKFGKKKN